MPRPRRGVTLSNLLQVDRYFALALKENRLFTNKTLSLNALHEAKEAFSKLPAIQWKTETSKKNSMVHRQVALQAWIDQFVDSIKWQRCLLTLRQKKSRKKRKLRRLDLPLEIYLIVKALALKQDLTLAEAIYKLAKPAFEKLSKTEYKKELGLAKLRRQ
jgi:hypothetical protein